MESISNLRHLLADMSGEVQRLNDACMELDGYIAKEAEYIDSLDRIAEINALKARLVSEVDRIKGDEKSSEHAFDAAKVFSGMLHFAAGSLTSAVVSKKENPFSFGFKLATKELGKEAGFGTVMMAAKKDGKLEDIETIAVSRLAREAKTTEADIMSSFESKGFSLMTPEDLWESLDRLKEEIKEGKGNIDLITD